MKEIKKISSGILSRQYKILKIGVRSGRKLLKSKPGSVKEAISDVLESEVHRIVNELGVMKGSLMKVGQFLALYSDSIISPELQKVLSQLENKSMYLRWDEIKKNIPEEFFDKLIIEEKPIAAASLGQVHRATFDGVDIVLKIQYKGVKKAINSDIRILKYILKLTDFVPKDIDLKPFFEEVKEMLKQETDYIQEAKNTKKFKELIKDSKDFYIPEVYEDFSNSTIITSEYISGVSLREVDNLDISQEDRNRLGMALFNLFFTEIYEWGLMQTDPNAANYLLMQDEGSWKVCLIDFGATKEISPYLQGMYKKLIGCIVSHDFDGFVDTMFEYKYLSEDKRDSYDIDLLKNYVAIVSDPFRDEEYDWEKSEIPDRVLSMAPKVMKEISISSPPKEIVFIDRKIGGVFFLLKILKAKFNPNDVVDQWFKDDLGVHNETNE